ncbi:MAG: MtnX-like HAD-IB family phosphatase [Sporolactobacillus sp.]|jgi:2,3-diketo-5-methylthio-1-phosphopentane phosphatase|nr:MtnX-like HAD-IB family phosphatase [Sporolactobacillus sp.]
MKKSFLFISDFDGTLSKKDFYRVLIDRHYQADRARLYADWENKTVTDLEYLSRLFAGIGRDETGIDEEIDYISLDPHAKAVIDHVQRLGGDFVVISAGTDYYIRRVLKKYAIRNVRIFANPGVYANRGIKITADPAGRYYSPMYGIDKAKVTRDLIKDYRTVWFAGDSRPDLEAALLTDVIFAKGQLQGLLNAQKRDYVAIDDFSDIENYLGCHEETLCTSSRDSS